MMRVNRAFRLWAFVLAFAFMFSPAAWAQGPQDLFIKNVNYSTSDGHVVNADFVQASGNSAMMNVLQEGYKEAFFDSQSTIVFQDQLGFIYDWGANVNSISPKTWDQFRTDMAMDPVNTTSAYVRFDRSLQANGSLAVAAYPLEHGTVMVGEKERNYEYYVPSSYEPSESVPLVLSFHGYQSNGEGQRNLTGLDLLAEKYGFIAVFPNGVPIPEGAGLGNLKERPDLMSGHQGMWVGDAGDLQFVSGLISDFKANYSIDSTRVYATGMSNGSMFSHALAVELSDEITGIVGATGPLTGPLVNQTPKGPITVIHCQGTDDPIVSYDGDPQLGALSAEQTVDQWVNWNQTSTQPEITQYPQVVPNDPTSITKYVYSGGFDDTKVIFYKVEGGGHTWPGGPQYLPVPFIGLSSQQISLSEEVWKDLNPGSVPAPSIHRPIIFVHGGAGSAAQFESQAMRFASNGYPADWIIAFEYDSSKFTGGTIDPVQMAEVWSRIDQLVDTVKQSTKTDKIDIVAHSLGNVVTQGYLKSSSERAANFAHYVCLDGYAAESPPGGVPSLGLWAGVSYRDSEIGGGINITLEDQSHVEVATSSQSFVEMYNFFNGNSPATSEIVSESGDQVELAGRAVLFPQNTGPANTELEIWEIDGTTGYRTGDEPAAAYQLDNDGAWEPFMGKKDQHYEFVLIRDDNVNHNEYFYFEPFIRSTYFLRLPTSAAPGVGLAASMDSGEEHVNLIVGRNQELWGDQPGHNDILEINGTDIVSNDTHPVSKRVNYTCVYDKNADGTSDLGTPIAYYSMITFFTGVDFHIPGANPPDGSISIALTSRTGGGQQQVINIPNRASSSVGRIHVHFRDFVQ
ncbi:MAG: hypothetical protein GXY50_02310 [Syntrophomonadaceae bacterium]|nr:hypothetical protein [Syntrophomonadaceae bacterium]